MQRSPRLALALALVITGATGLSAHAAKAPRTTTTSSTFFLRQDGCGAEAGPGRLEPKRGADSATGCGVIGGLPLDEVASAPEPFTTVGKGVPVTLDAARKATGQLAAGSWYGVGLGGVGTVAFDVALSGTTATGEVLELGATTVSGSATPGEDVVLVPFAIDLPDEAKGAVLRTVVLEVTQRGAHVGMSAKQYDGDSYLVLPTKAPAKKK